MFTQKRKMCRVNLSHSEAQDVINELAEYYWAHKLIIKALLFALIVATIGFCYYATHDTISNVKSAECRFYLREEPSYYQVYCLED
jgi:hypothetical protein